MIHHYNADPNITFPISIGVIVTIMVLYGIYKGFFDNEGLDDPFDALRSRKAHERPRRARARVRRAVPRPLRRAECRALRQPAH